jgi:two-component system nitrogen regulation sensor histidine kinase NtrY
MTAQLEGQTQALVNANAQLDVRRVFIETVLESITAGIISVGTDGTILLMNSSAQKLLLDGPDARRGPRPGEIAPQIAQLVASGERAASCNMPARVNC